MSGYKTLSVARLGTVEYQAALALQDAIVQARYRDEIGDTLLLLEHPHVFTMGRGADERFLLDVPAQVPVYRVSRGGQVTYHGPGQLIGYPILKLEGSDRDVIRYLRHLERAMIDALATLNIEAERRQGLTGVWVGTRKIASIGVGLRRWVTLHGFALNVTTDLRYFDVIVPCGIDDCRMTSVKALSSDRVTVDDFATIISASFASVFGYDQMTRAAPSNLWELIDHGESACDAHK